MFDIENMADNVIAERTESAQELAKKFPELKGLSWMEFLEKLPMPLDFITASEMYDAINKSPQKEQPKA